MVDFAELLLRAYELWKNNPDLREHYQNRFQYILVDEFQDTNTLQYSWIKLLVTKNNSIMLVGDDDQSIYGWRGAKIENIQRFEHDFLNTKIIRLEQNYRSTGTILKAANALISNNDSRLGKSLWTEGSDGELISLYDAFNDQDEARFVVNSIANLVKQGKQYKDCVVLYRSNAQSRVLEEALIERSIPYLIYGGFRFFERAEIKNVLAYLRLIENKQNDSAFERIVNTPPRGIGSQTIEKIRTKAREFGFSMWEASQQLIKNQELSNRAMNALQHFLDLIEQASLESSAMKLHELIEHLIHVCRLVEYHRKEKGEKGRARIENLQELIHASQQFKTDQEESQLVDFLSHAALESW